MDSHFGHPSGRFADQQIRRLAVAVLAVVLAAVAAAVPAIVAVLAVIHVIVIVSHGSYLLISFIEFVTGVVWLVPDQLFIFPDFFSYFLKPPFFNRISICFLCIDLV